MTDIDFYTKVIYIEYNTRNNRYKFVTANGHVSRYVSDSFTAFVDRIRVNGFVQIDAWIVANLRHCESIDNGHMVFSNGDRLPIARSLEKRVKEAYELMNQLNGNEHLIFAHDKIYIAGKNEDGTVYCKRYNDKTKMWVKINFSNEPNYIDEEIIGMLSKEYLRKEISKLHGEDSD